MPPWARKGKCAEDLSGIGAREVVYYSPSSYISFELVRRSIFGLPTVQYERGLVSSAVVGLGHEFARPSANVCFGTLVSVTCGGLGTALRVWKWLSLSDLMDRTNREHCRHWAALHTVGRPCGMGLRSS